MNETREELLSLIEQGIQPDEIFKLYQVLYDREFFSCKDFDNDYTWFSKLLLDNIPHIAKCNQSGNPFLNTMLIKKYLHISPAFNWVFSKSPNNAFHTQQNFADTVMVMLGDSKARILEVGCGPIPYVSLSLAEKYGLVYAMDKALKKGMQREVLNRMCVDSVEVDFNKDVQLNDVDVVIGQKPCPSIEMIVDQCVSEGKPYILEVCHCGEPEVGWKTYLADKYNSKVLENDNMFGCMDIVYDLG